MGKTPSEIQAMPEDDRNLLIAAIVDEQRRTVNLINDLAQDKKLTPEAYALLMRELL